ncbi:TonB family C-terminal domain-containing protein [Belliella buryatensis]|uniref:TonB family C-terminal domain-containing protein n=1 Tax=Belliella buryatensis TaxID=1500549 RepID=A0A239C5W2_9BACT|nr:TonB family protein [Belliella buryatensis]SNS15282.1 TonB family C-terminal domain-containing protein [Belliella buryatensis]
MAVLIDYIWQSTFCLFFFFGIYWVFLRNEKAFVFTRVYILITPILALLFPLMQIPVEFYKPDISLEQSQLFRALTIESMPEEVAGTYGLPEFTVQSTKLPVLLELKDYFLIGYLIIISLLAIRLFWQMIQLRLLQEKGWYQTSFKLKGNYFLIPTFGLAPIFSYFNKLFWDETQNLSHDEKDQIIKHEIEHIRQHHSWDVLYYQVLSIIFWFNPAIHLMRSALVDVHEYLADENVLKQTENKESYPKLIAKIAFKGMDLPIGNYFIRSTTLKRILMIKKTAKPNWFKLTMVIPLTIMLMALISMKTKLGVGFLLSSNTEKIEFIKEQLIASQDSIEIAIKVKKINNPKHYELIGSLKGDQLTAQLGELVYDFADISSDEEYLKVRSLINTLRRNSSISKSYGEIPYSYVAKKRPAPEDATSWSKFVLDVISKEMSEKDRELNIRSSIQLEFILSKDGKITNPVIKQSFGGGVDEKLLEAIQSENAPKWIAGEIDGKKVDLVHSASFAITYSADNQIQESLHYFPQVIEVPIGQSARTYNGDEIFDVVENAPVPPGGMEGWNEYLRTNLEYPEDAKRAGIEGTAYVVFVITKDGKIEQPEIIRGVSPSIDQEALRVVANGPDWTPGKQRGREVNVRMRLPIRFKQNSSNDNKPSTIPADMVDQQAEPQGGMDAWNTYIKNNLKYPQEAKIRGVEGVVYLTFIVDKDGDIKEPEILRGIGAFCDEEALRLVENSPKWKPGKKDGEAVESRLRLPIRFDLEKSTNDIVPKPTAQFNEYLRKNIKYPTEARGNNESGSVIARLTLDKDGNIIKSAISKGISKELNEEVLRVLEKAPNWNVYVAGEYDVLLPITFRIDNVKNPPTHNLPHEVVVVGYSGNASKEKTFEYTTELTKAKLITQTNDKPILVLNGEITNYSSINEIGVKDIDKFVVGKPSPEEISKSGRSADKVIYIYTKEKK